MRITRQYLLLAAIAVAALLVAGINQAAASNNTVAAQSGSATTRATVLFNSPIGHYPVLTNPRSAGWPINLTTSPENRPNVAPVFGSDIQIDPASDNPTYPHNETFMAANPLNRLNFISGANDYNIVNNNAVSVTGHYYSADGGTTWVGSSFLGPYPGGSGIIPSGDPIGAFDAAGNAYFGDLGIANSNQCLGGIYAHHSTDGGATYGAAVRVAASDTSHFLDKPWLVTDKSSGAHAGRVYMTWTRFTIGAGCNFNTYVSAPIYLAYSDNHGASWSAAVLVSDAAHNADQGSNIAVASDGTVYVAFDNCQGNPCTDENRIARSTNGGVSFSPSTLLDTNRQIGFIDTDGYQKYQADTSHAFRANQFPAIVVSPSDPNTIYAVWNDHLSDGIYTYQGKIVYGGDIAFSHSNDGGNTWSAPIRVNDDPQGGTVHDQFFPAITVGSDGTIHVAWFDRRDDPNNILYREYYAQSTNGGASFNANQAVADVGSNPANVIFGNGDGFIGDYSGVGVNHDNSIVLPIWTDERSAEQHIYTDHGAASTPTPTSTPAPTNTPAPTFTPQPTVCANPFVDINSNIFFHAINSLYCQGVVNGTSSTTYSPAGTATRGQFAKVVVLGFGTPFYTPGSQDFVDVPPSYFAYTFIESGFHAGILSGYDQATCTAYSLGFPCYLPNVAITRGQLTKLVVNAGAFTLYTPTGGVPDFVDVPPSNVFYVSIETAYHNSVVHGYPGALFLPNNPIRRDEMAQIVYEGIVHKP